MSHCSQLFPGPDDLVHTMNKQLNSALSSKLGTKDQAKNSALEEMARLEEFSFDHILLNGLLIPVSLQLIILSQSKPS